MEEFEEIAWEKIKKKSYDVLATNELKKEILTRIGYRLDEEGYLIDTKTGQRVQTEDGREVNLDKDKEVGVVTGSHIFVRNVAGYAHVLTKKGIVKTKIEVEG